MRIGYVMTEGWRQCCDSSSENGFAHMFRPSIVAEGALKELSADCAGIVPKIACPCCTVCFDASSANRS